VLPGVRIDLLDSDRFLQHDARGSHLRTFAFGQPPRVLSRAALHGSGPVRQTASEHRSQGGTKSFAPTLPLRVGRLASAGVRQTRPVGRIDLDLGDRRHNTTVEAHRKLSILRMPPAKQLVEAVRREPSRTRALDDPILAAALDQFIALGMAPQIGPTVKELLERSGQTRYASALTAMTPTIAVGGAAATGTAATAQRFDDGSWLIVYDVGLEAVLWYAAQLLVLVAREDPADTGVDPIAAARAIRLGVAVAALGFDANDLLTFRLDDERLIRAGELFTEMELFVLAHEVGHVLDGRDPLAVSTKSPSDWHTSENLADEIGVELMMGDVTPGRDVYPDLDVRFAAVRLLMSVLAAYERGVFAVQPRSHPLALDRWRLVEPHLRARFGLGLRPIAAAAEAFAIEIEVIDDAHPDVERDADVVLDALALYVVPTVAAQRSVLDGVAKGYLLLNPPPARLVALAGRRVGTRDSFAIPPDVLELATELRSLRDRGVAVTRRQLSEMAERSTSTSLLPSWMSSALAAWIVAQDHTSRE